MFFEPAVACYFKLGIIQDKAQSVCTNAQNRKELSEQHSDICHVDNDWNAMFWRDCDALSELQGCLKQMTG